MKLEYKGKKYELKIDDLTQGQVEAFFRMLREDYPDKNYTGVEFQGNSVRVANSLGWINPMIEVSDCSPGLVKLISETISETISGALEIDPK